MSDGARSALQDRISYAQCWEDHRVLEGALRVGPDDDVLSICSAGDNAFALAIAGARSVTCVDFSAPQLALAELKLVAARELPVEGLRNLLGFDAPGRRVFLYHQVRGALSEPARRFWDAHEELLRLGVCGQGRFERYLGRFRERLLPLVHGRDTVDAFLRLPDVEAQRRFYDARWDTWRWRMLFRLFFSRPVMARSGRSAAQFRFVEGPVADVFLGRTKRALTELPVLDNPYVWSILSGGFADLERAHPYLSTAGHAALAAAASRVRFVHGGLDEALAAAGPGAFSAFNYSDVPEYLSEEQHRALLQATLGAARPGARLAYWNLLVPRWRPEALADRLDRDEALAATLHARDRAFFYGAFQVEVVR
jgi:S-adenosylmethionine-diacylglycerol 3-amino-3-carboxypropyl transferase